MMKIGFIGLGNMGSRMSRRLVAAGFQVTGHDPFASNLDGVVTSVAESLADLAGGVDVILMSLPDNAAVRKVMGDEKSGLTLHLKPGQVVVDLSTSDPDLTMQVARQVEKRGAAYVDAGISGGAKAAEAGSLTLMVGGDAAAFEKVTPVFAPIAKQVIHMGESGSGHATKLINNFLNAINLSATAEAMVAGKLAGLDLEKLLEVINASSGSNWASQNRFPSIIKGDYLEGGLTSKLMLKDLRLYLEYASKIGMQSLHSSGPAAAFGMAIHAGLGDQISNRVVDVLGDLSGGVRLYDQTQEVLNKPSKETK